MSQEPPTGITYAIEGRTVTAEEFEAKLATLTEVQNSWFCDETTEGGDTGYEGTDADGVRWRYNAETTSRGTHSTIVRVDHVPPVTL